MKSFSGAELFPFASHHAAWRDTVSDAYCVQESFEDLSMCWTDASTTNAIQLWSITPAGFGMFFDLRSGQQLMIIATSESAENEGSIDFFTNWCRYLQDFNQLNPDFCTKNGIEAIRLEAGNRM